MLSRIGYFLVIYATGRETLAKSWPKYRPVRSPMQRGVLFGINDISP